MGDMIPKRWRFSVFSMITTTLLAIPVLVFISALDSLAQFKPVIANHRTVIYLTQSDGSEIVGRRVEGTYFRSSSGSVMQTEFPIENGEKLGKGQSVYTDSKTGKIHLLDHDIKKATLKQVRPTPFSPPDRYPSPSEIIGKAVIGSLNCVAVPSFSLNYGTKTRNGKTWWSLENYLMVKTEHARGLVRRVWELYDIQFDEPDASVFRLPADYGIDDSEWKARNNSPANASQ